jgi:PiT family inorganic phosphate transporter
MPADEVARFAALAQVTQQSVQKNYPAAPPASIEQVRTAISTYVRTHALAPDTAPAVASLTGSIAAQVKAHGSLGAMPADTVANVRNDMYLTSEAIRFLLKDDAAKFDDDTRANLKSFKSDIDKATKFIPLWVKVAVAIALGLGTMIGWKRIVVTVGEKIGKTHLNYAQGASAEMVAMLTSGAADMYGLPVSTTHVLSSGVAGAMTASGSGLQLGTLRNIAMAWVLTLPVAMLLSGSLYWILNQLAT